MRDNFAFLRDTESPIRRIAVLMQCEPDDDDDLVEAVRLLVSERAEVERMRERIATQEDGLRHGEQVCARLVTERDNAMRTLARVQRELKQALDGSEYEFHRAEAALDELERVRETGKVEFKPLADLLRDEP